MADAAKRVEVVTRLYTAFQNGDADGMAACYAPDATFTDEAFVGLKGDQVGARVVAMPWGD